LDDLLDGLLYDAPLGGQLLDVLWLERRRRDEGRERRKRRPEVVRVVPSPSFSLLFQLSLSLALFSFLTFSWNTSCVSWKMPRTAAFFSSRERPRFLDCV